MTGVDTSPVAPPPSAGGAAPARSAPPSLRRRTIRASLWTLLGYGTAQALRFGANLVLTRLLWPEAFGTMALVNALVVGLHLFSDVGIVPSIVQSRRGDDPRFLNVAWTIQAARGVLLWVAACALALPFASLYSDPALATLVPVAAFTTVLDGLCSTKLHLLNRHLAIGRLTLVELMTQTVSIAVMLTWAALQPGLWALVAGAIAGQAFRAMISHRLPGHGNRLQWDPALVSELLRFGKWIFLSTLLTFLAEQSDRLLFGALITREELGVYNIAIMLALLPTEAVARIGSSVFFPSYARQLESGGVLEPAFRTSRAGLAVAGGWLAAGMIAVGEPAIAVLYDPRYAAAGWMLQILAVGAWFRVLEAPSGAALLALGQARTMAAANLGKAMSIALLIPGGWALGGFAGALTGFALASVVKYAITALAARRHGLLVVRRDLLRTAWVGATGLGALQAVHGFADRGAAPWLCAAGGVALVTAAWAPVASATLGALLAQRPSVAR